jgi:hypothetical protein
VSTSEQNQLARAAREQGLEPAQALAFLATLQRRLGGAQFYVYRGGGNSGGGSGSPRPPRQVVAFSTADTALAFAQCNAPGVLVRLRALTLAQLLALLLQSPTIDALLFVADSDQQLTRGRLPHGLHLQRDEVLRLLQPQPI